MPQFIDALGKKMDKAEEAQELWLLVASFLGFVYVSVAGKAQEVGR